jgi:predicted dehydrogenase
MAEDTYGHTPFKKAFEQLDVYGVGYDETRAARQPIRLGLIGAGGVAQSKYFPAVARLRMIWEPVEIAAFAEPREAHGRKVQAIYGGQWFADYRDMLAQVDLDGVVVLSPDDLHAAHTLAALEAGKPVLVEKPIARSLDDASRMSAAADARKLPLMTVANKRYSPPYRRARQAVSAGPVQNPALFVGKFNLGYDYVDLFESGTIHLFDLTRYLMGDVAAVSAVGVNKYNRNRRRYPVDNATMTVEFASGAVGTLYTSSSALSFKPWERVEVYGDHAWLSVEDQHELVIYASEEGPMQSWRTVIPNTLLFDEEFGGYMGILENFAQVIRCAEQPIVTGWDGYKAFEMLRAVQLSLARKTRVTLPLDPTQADDEALVWLRAAGWPGG